VLGLVSLSFKRRYGFLFGFVGQCLLYPLQANITFLICNSILVGMWLGAWYCWRLKRKTPEFSVTDHASGLKAIELIEQQLLDSKTIPISFPAGDFDAEDIGRILGVMEQLYKDLGGQRLVFNTSENGFVAKPRDEPEW